MSPLQRYVSKELTHFVGRTLTEEEDQYKLLIKILKSGWLSPPPHEHISVIILDITTNARISENEMYSPMAVCFCDIPVDDLGLHISKYSPFGLSFLKLFIVQKGANPVFYISKNSTLSATDSHLRSDLFDEMLRKYQELSSLSAELRRQHGLSPQISRALTELLSLEQFLNFQVFSFLKCFDDKKPDDDPDNFYMEREWRLLGNLDFQLDDVHRVILPQSYARRLRQDVPEYVGQVTFVEPSPEVV